MREVFAQAWRDMARRRSAYWQFMAYLPAVVIAVVVAMIVGAVAGIGLAIFVGAVLTVFLILFSFGAAYGAVGEATAGLVPSPYFRRGWQMIGKAAAFFGSGLVAGFAILIVASVLISALFGQVAASNALMQQIMVKGSNPALAISLMQGMLVRVTAATAIVSLAAYPLLQGLAAGLFAGRMRYAPAFYYAGQEYVKGRFPQWILVFLVNLVGTVVYEALYFFGVASFGGSGQLGWLVALEVLGFFFIPLWLWYTTALSFALWASHQPKAPPDDDPTALPEPTEPS